MSQSRKSSFFNWFGGSERTPETPTETPIDNSFVQEQMKAEPTFEQRLKLQELKDTMFCRSLNENDPLHGFEKGYHNTLKAYEEQLEQGAFDDPQTMTDFTNDFGERYVDSRNGMKEEEERMVDPWGETDSQPPLQTKVPPSHEEWKKTVEKGEMLQSLPLPSWVISGLQTMIGAETHITQDLQPSLESAYEKKRGRDPESRRGDLEQDFMTGGEPFHETTRKTGSELGIPGLVTELAEPFVGVEEQRNDQFSQWKEKDEDL